MKAKRLIKNSVVCFSGILLIISGFVIYVLHPPEAAVSEKSAYTSYVRATAAKKISEKHNIDPIGVGGQMLDQVEKLFLYFNAYREVDETRAREMIIDSIDIFLSEVNSHEQLQRYLANVPFTHNNIELRIFFFCNDYKIPSDGKLTFIKCQEGKIYFYFGDDEYVAREPTFSETYEEAVAKVKATKGFHD